MPSLDNHTPQRRNIDWLGIMRTLLMQVLVLVALAGALIFYLDWSSQKAWTEFSGAADTTSTPRNPLYHAQTMTRVPPVHGQLTCERRA